MQQGDKVNQPAMAAAGGAKGGAVKGATERKIQFSAAIRVVVEDFDAAGKQLEKLVAENGDNEQNAYISAMDISGSAGAQRSGTYTIRVPVAKFNIFRDAVQQLGKVESTTITSDDRTMEYYDLEDRIKAKKKHREELDKFSDKARDVKDLREISEDIHRVQEQLDQMQGQFNRLGDLTSMTTVTVTLIARENWVPPRTDVSRPLSAGPSGVRSMPWCNWASGWCWRRWALRHGYRSSPCSRRCFGWRRGGSGRRKGKFHDRMAPSIKRQCIGSKDMALLGFAAGKPNAFPLRFDEKNRYGIDGAKNRV
jgi:hypothetical protein